MKYMFLDHRIIEIDIKSKDVDFRKCKYDIRCEWVKEIPQRTGMLCVNLVYTAMYEKCTVVNAVIQGDFYVESIINIDVFAKQILEKQIIGELFRRLHDILKNIQYIGNKKLAIPDVSVVSFYPGDKKCSCCGGTVNYYLPIPKYYEIKKKEFGCTRPFVSEMVNKEAYTCPYCGASDRDRAYSEVMRRELPHNALFTFLDIAPSNSLQHFIHQEFPLVDYKSLDKFMSNVDYHADIMDMRMIENDSIDFFLCSHVLEHVRDDMQAMRELKRILSPNGKGILVVPIDLSANYIEEDPDCQDEGERWRRFGQGDHVRRYSRQGYLERLYKTGFQVRECNKDYFGTKFIHENSLKETSCVYLVSK